MNVHECADKQLLPTAAFKVGMRVRGSGCTCWRFPRSLRDVGFKRERQTPEVIFWGSTAVGLGRRVAICRG
jgi:hypothetical protein